nr:MAG TPA: protein of unknown function DUF4969 [Caudoviricetes sp.]DAI27193.1 MAG TPA: protein of unknown function (DUF4969) [Caudoviricetes sp.]
MVNPASMRAFFIGFSGFILLLFHLSSCSYMRSFFSSVPSDKR